MMQGLWDDDPPGKPAAGIIELSRVLAALNLPYKATHYTENNVEFWTRVLPTAANMLVEFGAEEEYLAAIKADKMTRYF